MTVLHQTDARTFADCPACYRASRVRTDESDHDPFVWGNAVHRGLGAAVKSGGREGSELYAWAQSASEAFLNRVNASDNARSVTDEILSDFFLGNPETGRGPAWHLLIPPKGVTSHYVEQPFSLLPDFSADPATQWTLDAPGAGYSGTFDWLKVKGDGVEVDDWKTALPMHGPEDVRQSWQARLYAAAVFAIFPGIRTVKFRLVMVRHGYPTHYTFKRKSAAIEKAREWFSKQRAAILEREASGEWEQTPGRACEACPLRRECPSLARTLREPPIDPRVLPDAELGRLEALFASLGRAYDAEVKARAKERDIPGAEGKVRGYRPSTKLRVVGTPAHFMDAARAAGMTREEIDAEWPRGGPTKDRAFVIANADIQRDGLDGEHQGAITTDLEKERASALGLVAETTEPQFGSWIAE